MSDYSKTAHEFVDGLLVAGLDLTLREQATLAGKITRLIASVVEDCARVAQHARVECGDEDCRGACCVQAIRALVSPPPTPVVGAGPGERRASCGHELHPRGFGCTHDGCPNDSRQFSREVAEARMQREDAAAAPAPVQDTGARLAEAEALLRRWVGVWKNGASYDFEAIKDTAVFLAARPTPAPHPGNK